MENNNSNIERINYASNSPLEPLRGFSRAVVVDDKIYISGTSAISNGGTITGGADAYQQTKAVIDYVKTILAKAGFATADVIRTKLYVTDISLWKEFARAHHEAFDKIRPASQIVEVAKLTDPRLLIEMEVEAIRGVGAGQMKHL